MFSRIFCRFLSAQAPKLQEKQRILSWVINEYGDFNQLELMPQQIPIIYDPNDLLIETKATSINPIDSYMMRGYGQKTFQILRKFELEFPLVLGRDFSGVVVAKGHGSNNKFNIGDEVYGFIPIHKRGTFSELVLASACHTLPKPTHLSHAESASLVYAGMTAWSGLFLAGNLACRAKRGLRVLVLGGSGGVGTFAIQLLKSQRCVVYATCSQDAIPLVTSLSPDVIFDRNDSNFEENVELEGKYHIILDAANMGIKNIPNKWNYESYVTLNGPLLVNNDEHGIIFGLLKSAGNLIQSNLTNIGSGKTVRWGYFIPSNEGFRFINDLIIQKEIKPVIQKEFDFKELPCAIETIQQGHARGKIVVKN